jgi:hypothetical protein
MGCGVVSCGSTALPPHEIQPINLHLAYTSIEKYDVFYHDATMKLRDMSSLLNNIEVVLDMFYSRTGLNLIEGRPLGYALIALVAAASAW